MKDGFQWYCEKCNNLLYAEYYKLEDIVKQLPGIMNSFFSDEAKRTCSKCNYVMEPPEKVD
jgi:3-hydroxyanthranilate 3,4-dioxygenase